MLYHGRCRAMPLVAEAVGVPLYRLFRLKDGALKYHDAAQMADAFKFLPESGVVVSGMAEDEYVEIFWHRGRRAGLIAALKGLQPALVTTPNFSMYLKEPRWDNLYNMKRIAISWAELTAAGLPTALHLNGRTDTDWTRWTEFLRFHSEVEFVAFEFATGSAHRERAWWYLAHLTRLQESVGRDLHLVLQGGMKSLPALRQSFAGVTYIDTNSFVKTTKRRRCKGLVGRRLAWESVWTMDGQPLDDLLAHNVHIMDGVCRGQMLESSLRNQMTQISA